ncbi:MAG: ATP-binding cassette domain-containing protein, partial [Planctomycetaceae bacterium]|nr:ATP-binding cassette domain-containing protein [Planctomycetaceae bacterium]
MSLIHARGVTFSYGGRNLLEEISLGIDAGERIGLVGRNGAGKSTLLKLLRGELHPDGGEVIYSPGCQVAYLAQDVPAGTTCSVFEEVGNGLGEQGHLVARLHRVSQQLESVATPELKREHDELSRQVDHSHAWSVQQQIEAVIGRMGLDGDARFESLSSGMKRRVLLAQALVSGPDVLLLDEPTNHLDIAAIDWLEDRLLKEGVTSVFVTHDRAFLQRLATRIVEVDRARLLDWTCDYRTFLARREAALEAEAMQEALFDKKLAAEEVWIRTGIKARRTRNEGRVRALERLREERRQRRSQTGQVRAQLQEAIRSGNLVTAAEGIGHAFDEQPVLDDVSVTIYRGDKIGIIGPNGAGKTTLLRILLGQLTPLRGSVRVGSNLQVAYFDQLREQLDEEKSAAENVADGKDTVIINGQSRHIVGYLQDFLFNAERARSLVRYLSGGERNRLLLARIFTRPANVLVLDEPTNDLDTETLQLLEELLVQFAGTVLLVSHDRAFLNNVVTSTLVLEGAGRVKEYAGGYDDWLRQRPDPHPSRDSGADAASSTRSTATAEVNTSPAAAGRPRKLSYREQQELDKLPALIESLEAEQAEMHS